MHGLYLIFSPLFCVFVSVFVCVGGWLVERKRCSCLGLDFELWFIPNSINWATAFSFWSSVLIVFKVVVLFSEENWEVVVR